MLNHLTEIAVDWSRQPHSREEGRWIAIVSVITSKESESKLQYPSSQFLIPITLSVVDGYLGGRAVVVDGLPTHIQNPTIKDRDFVITALSNAGFISIEGREGTGVSISPSKRLTDTLGKRKSELLDRSRPLGLHTWSDHPAVVELTDTVYAAHFGPRRSKVTSKLLRLLLLELYLAWSTDPSLKLYVPRSNNDYPESRYNGLGVKRTIIKVLDGLRDAGLIRQADGFWDRFDGRGKRSRIWPTGKLIAMFKVAGFGPEDIDTHRNQETVVLNRPIPGTRKKERIEYTDTDETDRMRTLLSDYNSLLARTAITLPGAEAFIEREPDEDDNGERFISLHDTFVYRVFNRASFDKGGRFYGGWWQDCPKELRRHILIDGNETVERDFPGMLPTLLYAEAGIDYRPQIEAGVDPYVLDDLPPSLASIATRDLCKKLFAAAINATNEQKAIEGVSGKGLTHAKLRAILALLKEKHQPIANRFGSGVGLKMMNREAQITERIIEHFTQQGIPVLTVHDSYIVAREHEKELDEQMQLAFTEATDAMSEI